MSISDRLVPVPVPDGLLARRTGPTIDDRWWRPVAMGVVESDGGTVLAVMDLEGALHLKDDFELKWIDEPDA